MASGAVEVRWVDLDPGAAALREARALLRGPELDRVARRATPELRRRSTLSLAARRTLCAELLGERPELVELFAEADGRRRARGPEGAVLSVSSSTAGDVGLVAAAAGLDLGCDVEAALDDPLADAFLERVASPAERDELASLDAARRAGAVLALWTRKEAYLKATGEGIGSALRRTTVPLGPDCWARRADPGGDGRAWWLFALETEGPGLAAAVAVGPSPVAPALHVRSA